MKKNFIKIILIIILIYNFSIIIRSFTNSSKTPDFFGIKTYIIVSGSMKDTINIGDIVVVKEMKKIEKNDIISFRNENKIITHRVIDIQNLDGKTKYQTKGDNNNTPDIDFIEEKSVEGKVILIIPFIGNILLFFQRNEVVIIGIIILYIFFYKKRKDRLNEK